MVPNLGRVARGIIGVPQWMGDLNDSSVSYRFVTVTNPARSLRAPDDDSVETWRTIAKGLAGAKCGSPVAPFGASCPAVSAKSDTVRLCEADGSTLDMRVAATMGTEFEHFLAWGQLTWFSGNGLPETETTATSYSRGEEYVPPVPVKTNGLQKIFLERFPGTALDNLTVEEGEAPWLNASCVGSDENGLTLLPKKCVNEPTYRKLAGKEARYMPWDDPNVRGRVGVETLNVNEVRAHTLFQPSTCGPEDRLPAFVNIYKGVPGAQAWESVRAFTFAYLFGDARAAVLPLEQPPEIQSLEELANAQLWVTQVQASADSLVRALYIDTVPQWVVDDHFSRRVGGGGRRGVQGALGLQTVKSLQGIIDAWVAVAAEMGYLSSAIEAVQIAIDDAGIANRLATNGVARQMSELTIRRAQIAKAG